MSSPVCDEEAAASTTADVSMTGGKRGAHTWAWQLLLLLCSLSGLIYTSAAHSRNSQLMREIQILAANPSVAPAPSPGDLSSAYPFMPALFVFGDSFVDTGNLNLFVKQGTPFPYGHGPRTNYVIGGRFSNGLILSDYLSQMLGLSALSTPFFEPNATWYYGCNFAFSGSGAIRSTNPGPLPDQTTAFKNFVSDATLYWRNVQQSGFPAELSVLPRYPKPESFAGGLYLVVIGANDVVPIQKNTITVSDVAASLQSTLQTIYSLGGRNFVVASPIDFGCIPYSINSTRGFCANLEEAISSALGEAYRSLLASLQTELPGATFLYLDLYNLTRTNSSNARPLGELLRAFDVFSNGRLRLKRPEIATALDVVLSNVRFIWKKQKLPPSEGPLRLAIAELRC
ncbi:hypothetical protein KFL_001900210 [Klebsormidium nitens]|uniref:GDSL esterase/lipase n=1 Tax=Klebsormidium nitens TaxID=105231 RepID=A0A1Y1I8Q6_KLENI|nr:hypothetical protein KFL_001900210 [Klebsormidium nitens]|eukprot:GAQ84478.1 hypothetical protein KFL_001900210 [Klebsormidium nitens]